MNFRLWNKKYKDFIVIIVVSVNDGFCKILVKTEFFDVGITYFIFFVSHIGRGVSSMGLGMLC